METGNNTVAGTEAQVATTQAEVKATQPEVEYDYEAPKFEIQTDEVPSVDAVLAQYRQTQIELEQYRAAYAEQQAKMERLLGQQIAGKTESQDEALVDREVYDAADPATRKILDYIQHSTGLVESQKREIEALKQQVAGVQKETKQAALQRYNETVESAVAEANERLGGRLVRTGAVLEEMKRSGISDPRKAAMRIAADYAKEFEGMGVVLKRERKADPAPMIPGAFMPQTINQPEWKTPNPNSLESLKARSEELKEWLAAQNRK